MRQLDHLLILFVIAALLAVAILPLVGERYSQPWHEQIRVVAEPGRSHLTRIQVGLALQGSALHDWEEQRDSLFIRRYEEARAQERAAYAIPRFQNTRGRANFAALKSDRRNVVAAQEAFFYVNRRYAVDLDSLSLASSKGVVLSVREVVADGFSASAYHRDSWPRTCAIFVGSATPLPPATANGIVACE